jgi:hypothetical protein
LRICTRPSLAEQEAETATMKVTLTKPAKNAGATYIWKKLAAFSDFSWHPKVQASKNIGSIEDGSPDMVGAVRLLTTVDGGELTETVASWSEENRSQSISIEGSALPPPVQSLVMTFSVREEQAEEGVFVDAVADVEIKWFFILLTPILHVVLKYKIGGVVDGIADMKEE